MQLDWGASGAYRVVQNVYNLINTWRYEVAYNRIMGMDTKLLDKPLNIAVSQYISEVYRIISEYEPRANVKNVKFIGVDDEGNMQFKVVVEV